jgi:hypothetical protein
MSGVPAAVMSPLRSFRILAAALMAALVVIGIALASIFGGGQARTNRDGTVEHLHTPAGWVYLVIVAMGAIAAGLVQLGGYRVPAIAPDADPAVARATGLQSYRVTMILRFAISESVAIVSIALLFAIASNTILPYVLAAAISFVLMAYHVWPSYALISRVQQQLDRNGGRSELAATITGVG